MKREEEEVMLDFCVEQHRIFNRGDWLNSSRHSRDLLRAVALLLAGGEWYGHHQELLEVARLLSDEDDKPFSALARENDLDCSRLNNMLRHRLRNALTTS